MDPDRKVVDTFHQLFLQNIQNRVPLPKFKTFLRQYSPLIKSRLLEFYEVSDGTLFDMQKQLALIQNYSKRDALKAIYQEPDTQILTPPDYTELHTPLNLLQAARIWKYSCQGVSAKYVHNVTRVRKDVTVGMMGVNNEILAIIFYVPVKNDDGSLNHIDLLLICTRPGSGYGRNIIEKFHAKVKADYPGQQVEVQLSSLDTAKGFYTKMGYVDTDQKDEGLSIMKKALGGRTRRRHARRTRKNGRLI